MLTKLRNAVMQWLFDLHRGGMYRYRDGYIYIDVYGNVYKVMPTYRNDGTPLVITKEIAA